MHDNVTKTYKKCNNDKTTTINIKAKIAIKLKLEDRIQILDDNEANDDYEVTKRRNAREILYGTTHHTL